MSVCFPFFPDGDNNRNGNNHQVDTVSESVDPGEDSIQLRNEDDNRGGNIEDIQVRLT